MPAVISKIGEPQRWMCWCEECQDGVAGLRRTVAKWGDVHNTEEHPHDSKEPLE